VNEQEARYESGNVTVYPEGIQGTGQLELVKSIVESISPYIDHRVHIRYNEIKKENPSFYSRLNPEYRDENYHDLITINSNYQYKSELPFYLIHELGHSLEEKLELIVKGRGAAALPVGIDDEYADVYADLIAVYILKPELLIRLRGMPVGQNTLLAIQEMFRGNDFVELRNKLDTLSSQEVVPALGSKEEVKVGERLAGLFERVFVKISEYTGRRQQA